MLGFVGRFFTFTETLRCVSILLISGGYFAGGIIAVAFSVGVAICEHSGVRADCTGQCHEVEAIVKKTTAGVIQYTNTFLNNELQGTRVPALGSPQGTYTTGEGEIQYSRCPGGLPKCPWGLRNEVKGEPLVGWDVPGSGCTSGDVTRRICEEDEEG